MSKFILTCFLIFTSPLTTSAQTSKDSVLIRIENLKKILDQADTLTSAQAMGYNEDYSEQIDSAFDINKIIANHLLGILNISSISKYNLDSLLSHDFLGTVHSKDKNLWVFNWTANNGGTWEMICNVFHYRTRSGKIINDFADNSEESLPSPCSSTTWFEKIYKLKSSNKNIYLCLSSSQGCSTCCGMIASVIEITPDKINYEYPAFKDEENKFSSCYYLDSRCGDIEKFIYDTKTQTIYFKYNTDDNTPIPIEENENSKVISGALRWNGKSFIEVSKK